MDDDGYTGPAELLVGARVLPVHVTLAGRFEPISGRYSWFGRVAAHPAVAELTACGACEVLLRTPHATVPTTLSDVDPWGRPRVSGTGAPPFAVLANVPDETG
jgi:hypothetical protein